MSDQRHTVEINHNLKVPRLGKSVFGRYEVLDHGVRGGPVTVYGRHRLSGWQPVKLVLAHQVTLRIVDEILEDSDYDKVAIAPTKMVEIAERAT